MLNYNFSQFLIEDGDDVRVVKLNENEVITNALINPVLQDEAFYSTPPQSPRLNTCYRVATNVVATGLFEGKEGQTAFFTIGGWRFFYAPEGMIFFVLATNKFVFVNNVKQIINLVETPTPPATNGGNGYAVGDYKYSAQGQNHSGFLLCNGAAVLRSVYFQLFDLIGTSFGGGNGTTTFNLPDFRGRVPGVIGLGAGLTKRNIGSSVGSETHTLTQAEVGGIQFVVKMDDGDSQTGSRPSVEALIINGQQMYSTVKNASLTTTASPTNQIPHNIMQPTLFAANMFIFSGVVA